MENFKWVWQYIKPYTGRIFIGIILLLMNAGLVVVNPYLAGILVDNVISRSMHELLVPILATMIGITLFRVVIRYIYQAIFERLGQDVLYQVRLEMFTQLHQLDFQYFNHTRVGDIIALMTSDTDAVRHLVSWVLYNLVEYVIWFISAILVMGAINLPLTLALLLVVPLIGVLAIRMSRVTQPAFTAIRNSFSNLNSTVEENISGNRVVTAFAQEDYEIEKFDQVNEDYAAKNLAAAKIWQQFLPTLDMLANVLAFVTIIFGGWLVIQNRMTIGQLVTFNGYLWMLNNPLRMVGWLINDIERFQAASYKIRDFLAVEPAIPLTEGKELPEIQGAITFDQVSFAYDDAPDTPVLQDINFHIDAGKTLGILGKTGAGKTTLVNLIGRYYDPTEGVVRVDGHNLRDISVRQLRDSMAMVMQDIFLFSDTIGENIAFGSPGAEDLYIESMAKIADADHFIRNMPEAYQTIVGERGVGLSGGQKQRISLARALAKNPAILILDDTTSAVDMETEAKIQTALAESNQNQTKIIIASRISSVRDADLILLLEAGKIIERGTHADLLAVGGKYKDIYEKQMGMKKEVE